MRTVTMAQKRLFMKNKRGFSLLRAISWMFLTLPIIVLAGLLLPACDTVSDLWTPSGIYGAGGGGGGLPCDPEKEDCASYLMSADGRGYMPCNPEYADCEPGSMHPKSGCDASVEGVTCGPEDVTAAVPDTENDPADRTNVPIRPSNVLIKFPPRPGEQVTVKNRLDKVNVLFVIDDSHSMRKNIDHIYDQFDDFLSDLGNMDVQVAVTTTFFRSLPLNRPQSKRALKGRFLTFDNGKKWLSNPKRDTQVMSENIEKFKKLFKRRSVQLRQKRHLEEVSSRSSLPRRRS